MSFDQHINFGSTQVLIPPSPLTSGTSITLNAGGGALMPTAPFNCVVCQYGAMPSKANSEIVRVTAIAGDVVTITRAQEGTSARAVQVGDYFANAITVKALTDIETAVGAITAANPTASVGLTAVNGVATTYMRSDAAPALSQAITPTWVGLHTFNAGVAVTGGTLSALTALAIRDTSAAFDLTIAGTSSTAFTAGRTLTLDLVNAARTLKLTGNAVLNQDVSTAGSPSFGAVALSSGNLIFSTTSQRITGDMTNATLANRVMVQTSTVNGITDFSIIPNGSATVSRCVMYNNSDPTNAGTAQFRMTSVGAVMDSNASGSGTVLPLLIQISGVTRQMIGTDGSSTFTGPIVFPNYTVAGLPSAASYTYGIVFVSDSTTTAITGLGLAPVGGGANKVPVFSDGAGWKII